MHTIPLTHRFAIPAFVAAAFHVVLLFGIRPEVAADLEKVFIQPIPDLPPRPCEIIEPPKVEPDPTVEPVQSLNKPGPVKPVTEDRSVDLRPSLTPDPVAPPVVRPTTPLDKIPEGGWGDGSTGKPQPFANGDPNLILSRYLDSTPRAKVQVAPVYPIAMRQAGIEGSVNVEFDVDATGKVTAARVVRSTAHEFEEAAVRAVLKWSFEPGRYRGKAVPFRMTVPISFTITQD